MPKNTVMKGQYLSLGVTAWGHSQSNTPDFGTLQFESRLRCYHTKSSAISKGNFNKNTAEKSHLGEGQKTGGGRRQEVFLKQRSERWQEIKRSDSVV